MYFLLFNITHKVEFVSQYGVQFDIKREIFIGELETNHHVYTFLEGLSLHLPLETLIDFSLPLSLVDLSLYLPLYLHV